MKKACMRCRATNSDYDWTEKYGIPNKINSALYLADRQ